MLIFEPFTDRAGESSLPIDFLSLVLGAPGSSFNVLRTVMVCEAEVSFDFSALGGKLLLSWVFNLLETSYFSSFWGCYL